jgi:hypothetical protein
MRRLRTRGQWWGSGLAVGVALNQTYGIPLPPGLAPTAADAKRVKVTSSH